MNLVVNDIVECKVYCQSAGQISQNIFHYRVANLTGDGATDQDAADKVDTNFAGPYKALLCNFAEYLGSSAQIIKPTRRPACFSNTSADSGTAGEEQIPRQVAGLIQLQTATASKHGRGRKFIPFPSEDDNEEDGKPSVGYVANLTALAIQLLTPMEVVGGGETATLQPVLYDRDAGTTLALIKYRVRSVWATQRRRGDTRHADLSPF